MTSCAPSDRILQTLRVHVPGAPDPLLELELFNVMDKFFRRTSAWKFSSEIEMVEGVTEYDFGNPSNTNVVRLMGVLHNGIPVPPASQAGGQIQSSIGELVPSEVFPDGDIVVPYALSDIGANHVFSYAIYRPNYIQIVGQVDAEKVKYPLSPVVVLTLAKSCLECDCGDWAVEEWMWDMYFQVWVDGALATLYGMPAKPWSNPQLALVHGRAYRNAAAFRKQEATRGFNYEVPAWRFPRGWV